jgi:RecA-family ATPase
MYMQAELRERRLKERLIPTYQNLTTEEKIRLNIWSTRGLILFGNDNALIEEEISSLRPDILIIDPMLNFHQYDERNSQDMASFFRYLDKIKERYDMAIIMAHHFRKQNVDPKLKGSLLDSIRGSTALRGWAVTTIAMEGRGESEYRELAFDLRNSDEPIKRVIKYNRSTKDFDWHDPVAIIGTWLSNNMNGNEMSANQFVDYILSNHGNILSNNRQKAFQLKKSLLEYHIISERLEGKKHIISLV